MSAMGTRGRVVVADDDAEMRLLITTVLRRLGFEVFEATDGEELLRWLFDDPDADLVITDLQMPNKSGLEVLHALRRWRNARVTGSDRS